jgi:hypothetical protein
MGAELSPEQVAIWCGMTGRQKLDAAAALYHAARRIKAAGLRRAHPDWDEERIQREVSEIFLRVSS